MKWPSHLALVRHGQSAFNKMKEDKREHPLWKDFVQEYNRDYRSERARHLAEEVLTIFNLQYSDYNTPDRKEDKREHPLWKDFVQEYNRDYRSERARHLAEEVLTIFNLQYSDYNT